MPLGFKIARRYPLLSNSWFYFFLLAGSNSFLAYGPGSLKLKLFVGFYGILLPLALFILMRHENQPALKTRKVPFPLLSTLFPSTTSAGWIAVAVLLFTRFFQIGSNPVWPMKDVGHFGILGLSISQSWDGRLLWGEFQAEPLYIWGLGLFFKLAGPSSLSTRLFPALLSLLDAGLAYWAARQFLPKGASLLAASFFMGGFATWFCSRTGFGPVALWPLQLLVFGLMGMALKPAAPWWIYLLLGLAAGAGFYSYTSWPMVFLSIVPMLLWKTFRSTRQPGAFLFFSLSSITVAFPMVLARFGLHGFTHLRGEFLGLSLFQSLTGYPNLLFWNGMDSRPDGPAWGGVLNPLETALFFMGLARMAFHGSRLLTAWFFLALSLCLLPGLLSNTIGMDHVIQVFPLMVPPMLAGLEELLVFLVPSRRGWMAVMLLLACWALNAYHWWGPYQDWKTLPPAKSDWIPGEYARAYGLLNGFQKAEGPGFLFTEFKLDSFNKTLELFCHPFDALQNPKWRGASPQWAALLVNQYYIPFLQKRFPQSRWEVLKKDPLPNDLDLALGIIPLGPSFEEDRGRWEAADQVCRGLDLERKRAGPSVGEGVFQEELARKAALFAGDPFLRSIFWEKMAMADAIRGDDPSCERDYESAIRRGYPAAHLFYNLSVVQRMEGKTREAGQNLEKAVQMRKVFLAGALSIPEN